MQTDLRDALRDAVAQSGVDTDESDADESWNDFPVSGNDDGESSTAEPPATEDDEPEAATVQVEDVPESYWGVDLSDIPPEKRAEVIAHFEQQDSTIRKLQERLSKEPEPTALTAQEEPEDISDEDLMHAIGLDPEDFEDQRLAPKMLPLARTIVALEGQVEQMAQERVVEKTTNIWNSQLDELETTYGKLPFNRVSVLQYAIEEGLTSPYETYFKLSAPVRKEVEQRASEARRTADKRQASVSVKPRSTGGGEAPGIKPGTSLRDAVAEAAKQAERETKLSWRDALKKRLVEVPD